MEAAAASATPRRGPSFGCGGGTARGGPVGSWGKTSSRRLRSCRRGLVHRSSSLAGRTQACKLLLPSLPSLNFFFALRPMLYVRFRCYLLLIHGGRLVIPFRKMRVRENGDVPGLRDLHAYSQTHF
jgi:hypothetical protein